MRAKWCAARLSLLAGLLAAACGQTRQQSPYVEVTFELIQRGDDTRVSYNFYRGGPGTAGITSDRVVTEKHMLPLGTPVSVKGSLAGEGEVLCRILVNGRGLYLGANSGRDAEVMCQGPAVVPPERDDRR